MKLLFQSAAHALSRQCFDVFILVSHTHRCRIELFVSKIQMKLAILGGGNWHRCHDDRLFFTTPTTRYTLRYTLTRGHTYGPVHYTITSLPFFTLSMNEIVNYFKLKLGKFIKIVFKNC